MPDQMAGRLFIDDLAARNGAESAAQRQVAMGRIGVVVLHSLCQYLMVSRVAARACQRGIVTVIGQGGLVSAVCEHPPSALLVPVSLPRVSAGRAFPVARLALTAR